MEFLVDSGSSVTAISDVLYGTLLQAGAPVGALQTTARTLRSANGTGIEVLGCSRCSVSFLDCGRSSPLSSAVWRQELTRSSDRCVGSVLPHTLDIKNGLLFTQGWSITTAAPARFSSIGSCVHGGTFVDTTIFRGCLTLLCPDHWWSRTAV